MAFTAKFTIQRGKNGIENVAIGAGSAESQSDTLSINLDVTNVSKGEALMMIEKARDAIHAAPWPPA